MINYNLKGETLQIATYNLSDSLTSKSIYEYKNDGREMEWTYYSAKGKGPRSIGKLDDKGNLLTEFVYSPNDSLSQATYSRYLKYDDAGNWILKRDSTEFFNKNKKSFFIQMTERKIDYY